MTGSALQALGVELTCESFCKGRGVRGEGGGRSRLIGGRRMTGSALQALGVEFTCESFVKGEGFGERVVAVCLTGGPADFLGGSRSMVFIVFSSLSGKISSPNVSKV